MVVERKKFLSADKLEEAIGQVAAIAKEENRKVILIGGSAMQLYGSDRLTADVDFAANETLAALPGKKRLVFGGIQTKAPNGVPVDFVVRSDDFRSLYEDAVQNAQRLPGIPMPVARPEHLVAMKMAAGRDKDRTDIAHLLKGDQVDTRKARKIVHQHLGAYAAQEFDGLVEEAAWMKTRANPRPRRGLR